MSDLNQPPRHGAVVPGTGDEFLEDDHPQGWLGGFIDRTLGSGARIALLIILCLFPLLAYVFVDLPPRAHIVLSLALIAAGMLISRRFPHMRSMIIFISLAASLRYILYRGTETLSLVSLFNRGHYGDLTVSVLLFGAELYALVTLLGGYFQTAIIRRNRPRPLDKDPEQLPHVDIFIPTYNEGEDVLRPTVIGAANIDYPNKTVFVLDDGCRFGSDLAQAGDEDEAERAFDVQYMCQEVADQTGIEVVYIPRESSFGAKAGNINHALYAQQIKRPTGGLVAFFDADHVPVRSFLNATVGFFLENDRLALVQTPHHFINPDPFIRNLYLEDRVPPEQHLFYHGIQLGNDFWNSAFFCGSCAVIRREALDEVNEDVGKERGLSHQTVTEDAHTALQIHAAGWDSLFLDIPLAAGLATESYAQHVGQRIRWARGMAQIVRLDNPFFKRGLSLAQRINYFNAAWHFFNGLPRLIFILTPALYLLFDLHPVNADVREMLVYAIPHLILVNLGAVTVHRNVRHSLWPEVYEVAIAPYTAAITVLAVLFPKRGKFNVTDKGTQSTERTFDFRHALPLLLMLGLQLAGLVVLPYKLAGAPLDHFTIWVAAVWNLYNLVIIVAAVLSAVERPQRRRFHRVERDGRVLVAPLPGSESFTPIEGDTVDLSQGGASFDLAGDRTLPEEFVVTLISPRHRTSPLRVRGLATQATREGTRFRVRFEDLSIAEQHQVSRHIYGDSNAWIGDRYTYDRYGTSVLQLLLSIPAALLGNPRWLDRLRQVRRIEKAPLIPGSDLHECDTCGALNIEGAQECEACGALLIHHRELDPQPARLSHPDPDRSLLGMLVPVAIFAIALALTAGFSPVVNAFSEFMPLQRWERVTFQTRLGEMNQAHIALKDAYKRLALMRRTGRRVPGDFSNRLFTIQRDYELFQGTEKRPEVVRVHSELCAIVQELDDAAKVYQSTFLSDDDDDSQRLKVVDVRLESIDSRLTAAANEMGLPQ